MSTVPALSEPFEQIHYPSTDGEPMAESDVHREELVYLIEALRDHFREVPDLYVSGNLLFYYQKGNPKACVAPDVFVVPGAGQRWRRKYLLWEEGGRVPCTVIEVSSSSTRERDLGEKKQLYARLGVAEYFVVDPEGELRGFRLRTDGYRALHPTAEGALRSRSLGLLLRLDDGRLRLIDEATRAPLLRGEEARGKARAEAAAHEKALTRAALGAVHAVQETFRGHEEHTARLAAEKRARREAAKRRELEAEVARLRRQLAAGEPASTL